MLRKTLTPLFCVMFTFGLTALSALGQEAAAPRLKLKSVHPAPHGLTGEMRSRILSGEADSSAGGPVQLPHWSFSVTSSRDGNTYAGVMVGAKPVAGSQATDVPVEIIPVIVNTVALGTTFNPNTGAITVATGGAADNTTFNPTTADTACLASPNDVPGTVFGQSPLFESADFNYGGTDVGFTQATDAFQRANFWNTINRGAYHVLLSPIKVMAPVTLNAPAPSQGVGGLALDIPTLFGLCGRIGIVDFGTIDNFVTSQIQRLAPQGVTPGNLPIFLFYNTAFSLGDPTNLFTCCAGGYHNAVNISRVGEPPVFQTYSPIDFDMTGFFINDSGSPVLDTEIASHEVAEWMNDPLVINGVPAWGNIGQDIGICQNNLEVGDPLTGNEAPRIFMPNHFTYHLQELAFFSWFYGSVNGGPPSLGLNDWFSDNDTFTANAGPVCQPPQ